MSVTNPGFLIPRQSVVGMEGEWAKMYDPPSAALLTPEWVVATNPVPEVMAAAGFQSLPSTPHLVSRHLMHGVTIRTFDNVKNLTFFAIADLNNPTASGGVWPAPTTRVPRGSIFHSNTQGAGPPPHTIHWHGIEPTPMNDGVGHCSMELGSYVYQWQPNFIGTYFYHCHRNTVQHFEFGLYGMLLIMPPDAYFASCLSDPTAGGVVTLNGVPIGACRDGRFRMATNLNVLCGPTTPADPAHPLNAGTADGFETPIPLAAGRFGPLPAADFIGAQAGFAANPLEAPDPRNTGIPANDVFPSIPSVPLALQGTPLPAWMQFGTDPHAMTMAYDVEALWVVDDRDSIWSDLAPNPFTTFPAFGSIPGVNDQFHRIPGGGGFFAFNQFNADYWFITGVPVPSVGIRPGTSDNNIGTINANVVVPDALNSGMAGLQVPINASTDQTIYLRCLDAAYNSIEVKFPCDIVITAWDGRALGVPPYAPSHPYLVPANTPIRSTTARRFDALLRFNSDQFPNGFHDFATIKFFDNRGEQVPNFETLLVTARIPINISVPGTSVSGTVTGAGVPAPPLSGVIVNAQGPVMRSAVTNAAGAYTIGGLTAGAYVVTPSLGALTFTPPNLPQNIPAVGAVDIVNQNFVAAAAAAGAFTLSGTVFGSGGAPLAGVIVTLGGPVGGTALTDASGNYTFGGISNGTYVIVPSQAGVVFTPAQRRVVVAGASRTVPFFRGIGSAAPI